MSETKKRARGFAAMDPARQREIAQMGGIAAHEKGVSYQWTSETARAAARKRNALRTRKTPRRASRPPSQFPNLKVET